MFSAQLLPAAATVPQSLTLSRRLASRACRQLKGLWESEGVIAQWEATSQAKKRKARSMRAATTDFERFQIQLAKTARSAKRKA